MSGCRQPQPLSTPMNKKPKPRPAADWSLWRRASGEHNPSTDPMNGLARSEQTCTFRVVDWPLQPVSPEAYGVMDSTLCDRRGADQMAHHILQDCSLWQWQRHQSWLQNEMTTKLWGTLEDLNHPIQFLAACGLRVWGLLTDFIIIIILIIIAFKGAIRDFFAVSSLRREPSPTRTLKWSGRNRVQIMCNKSSAYHVQHVVLCATWYKGTAQLLSLTEFKSHLF